MFQNKQIIFSTVFFLISYFLSYAEDVPDMVTDRPDQAESTAIVPSGWLQIESGITYGFDKRNAIETKTEIWQQLC